MPWDRPLEISGWKARLGVVCLLVFLVPTTLFFHGDVSSARDGFSASRTWRSSAACCWWPIKTDLPEGGWPDP
jgi:hypothetical protein